MKNLPPFYIGQKVIYITGLNAPKNSIHTVTDIIPKPCGCFSINIDNKPIIKAKNQHFNCRNCNTSYTKDNALIGWNTNSFRPAQESAFPNMTLKEVIKKELEVTSLN